MQETCLGTLEGLSVGVESVAGALAREAKHEQPEQVRNTGSDEGGEGVDGPVAGVAEAGGACTTAGHIAVPDVPRAGKAGAREHNARGERLEAVEYRAGLRVAEEVGDHEGEASVDAAGLCRAVAVVLQRHCVVGNAVEEEAEGDQDTRLGGSGADDNGAASTGKVVHRVESGIFHHEGDPGAEKRADELGNPLNTKHSKGLAPAIAGGGSRAADSGVVAFPRVRGEHLDEREGGEEVDRVHPHSGVNEHVGEAGDNGHLVGEESNTGVRRSTAAAMQTHHGVDHE